MSEGRQLVPTGPSQMLSHPAVHPVHSSTINSPPLNPPPPLMAIDQPNPPNVVISKTHSNSDLCHLREQQVTNNNAEFMQNTRQIITNSRLDPDLLASCANKDIDDVDLDRMYMEAMMEDFYSSVGR